MKRLLSVLTLCALMLALTACGNGNGASSGGGSSAGGELSFDAVYQGILAAQESTDELIFFPEEGADAIESLYPGLTALDPTRLQLYLPPVAGYACEILLVEVAEGDTPETLQRRVMEQAEWQLLPAALAKVCAEYDKC